MKSYQLTPKSTFLNLACGKRRHIVAVMVREFAVNGYKKASLNNIARDSGISKGSLYQYFASKEEMFLYVFSRFTRLVKGALPKTKEIEIDDEETFWRVVRTVLLTGVGFIESHPQYFKLYLRVLFEHDLPHREELIAGVRLFSREYFSPLVQEAAARGLIRGDISADMVVFAIDAMLDRFLLGYARPYLDSGLGLARLDPAGLEDACDQVLLILRGGIGAGV